MKKETTVTEEKSPVAIDKKTVWQNDDILFPKKVELAKQRIARYGLPDEVKKKR